MLETKKTVKLWMLFVSSGEDLPYPLVGSQDWGRLPQFNQGLSWLALTCADFKAHLQTWYGLAYLWCDPSSEVKSQLRDWVIYQGTSPKIQLSHQHHKTISSRSEISSHTLLIFLVCPLIQFKKQFPEGKTGAEYWSQDCASLISLGLGPSAHGKHRPSKSNFCFPNLTRCWNFAVFFLHYQLSYIHLSFSFL